MRQLLKAILLGCLLSIAFGDLAILFAQPLSALLSVYFIPAQLADLLSEGGHFNPFLWLASLVVPEGGPPGGLLYVLGTSFAAWAAVFGVVVWVISTLRRRRHLPVAV